MGMLKVRNSYQSFMIKTFHLLHFVSKISKDFNALFVLIIVTSASRDGHAVMMEAALSKLAF